MLLFDLKTSGDLRNDYPELADVPEFSWDKLNGREMVFVWAMGNKSGEFWGETIQKKKIALCLRFSKLSSSLSEKDRNSYISGKFPEKVSQAITRMLKFDPSVRMKAAIMAHHTFNELWREIFSPDISATQKADISQKLPMVIKAIEEGFGYKGLKLGAKGREKAGAGMMDRILQESD